MYKVIPLAFPEYQRGKFEFAITDAPGKARLGFFPKRDTADKVCALLNASADGVRKIEAFSLMHTGSNPGGYLAAASRTGDPGIYEEVRISVLHPELGSVGDVLVGLTEQGEPRMLITHNGEGDGDHAIAVYPLKPKDEAVDIHYN